MNASLANTWRVLIVEDTEQAAKDLMEVVPSFVDAPDAAQADLCKNFTEAIVRLKTDRYDLIILDLKDDSDAWADSTDDPAGLRVFEELKKIRFVPVVFYTALPEKVRSVQTSFVRVVVKSDGTKKVIEEVRRVLATKLPAIARHIEDVQRAYMWGFISDHWKDFQHPADQADVAYLLARRLAISLEAAAGELAIRVGGFAEAPIGGAKTHPMVMYVVPPLGPHPVAGDIVSESVDGTEVFWLILTPSCDFAQSKANHVLLVQCERLAERPEYKKWQEKRDDKTTESLGQLFEDKRGDRFKFLPSAFFIPDLVVDFQQLRCLSLKSLDAFKKIATLDSPFAESLVARFSRYYNRLGTPDIDKKIVFNRLRSPVTQTSTSPPAQTPTNSGGSASM